MERQKSNRIYDILILILPVENSLKKTVIKYFL